jgi:hypothetical protein
MAWLTASIPEGGMMRLVLAAAAFAAFATPALAYPNCLDNDGPGLKIKIGVSVGGAYTREEQEIFDKMELRQHGIDADTVERTHLGCMKITRFEGGSWTTEYYDPETFEEEPLNLRLPDPY